jgi:hypothetical protein
MKIMKEKGFILFLIIVIMAFMAVIMAILASAVNTMYFQTNSAYLKACERNLKASGFAWARQGIKNKDGENIDNLVELDVNDLNIRESVLKVRINIPADKEPEVQIDTSCSRGRQSLKHITRYKIEP